MLINKSMLRAAGSGLAVIVSLAAPPLKAQAASDADRIAKLERAVEALQKRNAQLESEISGLKKIDDFTLVDLEAVRLILKGESVIDWHRLNFENEEEARQFLRAQEFHPDEPADRKSMEVIKQEAIGYLRRHFEFPIPKPIENASVEELLMVACGRGHRQT